MKPHPTAFLVMVLDVSVSPPTIEGVGLFSEENPSMMNLRDRRQLTVMEGCGDDYEAGIADIRLMFTVRPGFPDYYGWLVPLMDERTRREVGR